MLMYRSHFLNNLHLPGQKAKFYYVDTSQAQQNVQSEFLKYYDFHRSQVQYRQLKVKIYVSCLVWKKPKLNIQ